MPLVRRKIIVPGCAVRMPDHYEWNLECWNQKPLLQYSKCSDSMPYVQECTIAEQTGSDIFIIYNYILLIIN